MIYIKINETLYPATVDGRVKDWEWNDRDSKAITLEMDYATAAAMFVDGLVWSIVMVNTITVEHVDETGAVVVDENGETIYDTVEQTEEFDNSEYCVAGDITDHRDGTITVKMGKFTTEEMLLMEVLA